MENNINRELVIKFIELNRLKSIPVFLNAVRRKQMYDKFSRYVMKQGCRLPLFGKGILFHGSLKKLKILKPQKTEQNIYATHSPNYALFLAVINLKEAKASVLVSKDKPRLSISTDFVNGKSTFENGYLHIVSVEGFTKRDNSEYDSKQHTPILFSFQVNVGDITVPIYVDTK